MKPAAKDRKQVTVYLDAIVMEVVTKKSEDIQRSISWMVNTILRSALGLAPEKPGDV